jgi:hypothetical protein
MTRSGRRHVELRAPSVSNKQQIFVTFVIFVAAAVGAFE